MPTPAIQTLINDAQQVLNLDSISAVRSVVAVSLANANTGTPLNPNLTTQQLWNEFYQVVTRSKSDIESIIANQLMKFLYSPPAPGGVGADKQVIFNDGGVLAGAANLYWDKANNRVGIGTATPSTILHLQDASTLYQTIQTASGGAGTVYKRTGSTGATDWLVGHGAASASNKFEIYNSGLSGYEITSNGQLRYAISTTGVHTWSYVGGVAGDAMTLDSTGLGVGVAPELKLRVDGPDAAPATSGSSTTNGAFRIGAQGASTNLCVDAGVTTTGGVYGWFQARSRANYASNYDLVLNPNGGNVGIGVTPAGTGGCLQLKSGITFPATQVASSDANTLDDYEEGTWTPTVAASSGTPTTVTIGTCKYTKIGRQVICTFDFTVVDKGTASGSLIFTLPFASDNFVNCGSFRENGLTGNMGQIFRNSTSDVAAFLYNNTTVWVDGYKVLGTYSYCI